MHISKKARIYATTVGTSAMLMMSPIGTMVACAEPSEAITTDTTTAVESAESESSQSEDELAAEYQQYLHSLEEKENNPDTLTPEEEAAGYQIIDGVKRAPEELEGDFGSEVQFGGITPGTNTGYVNFFTQLPEYIHENAYVIVMNLNTGAMFGCRTYEINGFQAQICLPAGIYMISEGGLSSDSVGRFYAMSQQFQVKSGSQQTIVADIVDTHPELAEKAYPEDNVTESQVESAETETTDNGTSEKVITKPADAESNESTPEDQNAKEKRHTTWLTVVLTILFTVIPLSIFAILYCITRKPKRGFDE